MKKYSEVTPTALDSDNTYQLDIFNSSYANIRYNVVPQQVITIDAKYEANLPGLAFDFYGDVEMWRVIFHVNGLADPINDVCVGRQLFLPTQASVDAYLALQNTNQSVTITI